LRGVTLKSPDAGLIYFGDGHCFLAGIASLGARRASAQMQIPAT
jgi:hypothetical protein